MKHILAFLCLLALASTQKPVPIPNINLNLLNGTWYVIWQYDTKSNNRTLSTITCFQYQFSVNAEAGTGSWEEILYINGNQYSETSYFVAQTQNSIWQVGDKVIEWIDFDVVQYNWFVAGTKGTQEAVVISRNTSLSNSSLSSIIQVIKGEGYKLDSKYTFTFSNNNCN